MLLTPGIIRTVAGKLEGSGCRKFVVDPVMIFERGSALLQRDAIHELRSRLLPLAYAVTPNIPEACVLLGWEEGAITTVDAIGSCRPAAAGLRLCRGAAQGRAFAGE